MTRPEIDAKGMFDNITYSNNQNNNKNNKIFNSKNNF